MVVNLEEDLVTRIASATRAAILRLRAAHPSDHFYGFSLVSTGQGHPPVLCAWSAEGLDSLARGSDQMIAAGALKWSHADSPFFDYAHDCFHPVRELFAGRESPRWESPEQWDREVAARFGAMERAMAILDAEGLFGAAAERLTVVVNVEVLPPDSSNVARARRLNPPAALVAWLREAGEAE